MVDSLGILLFLAIVGHIDSALGIDMSKWSDKSIISSMGFLGIDVLDAPWANGPFSCDIVVGRRCNGQGAKYTAKLCESMSESSLVLSTENLPGDLLHKRRGDLDGFERSFRWYSCSTSNKKNQLQPLQHTDYENFFEMSTSEYLDQASCDSVHKGPIVCLETNPEPTRGTRRMFVEVPGANPLSAAANSGSGKRCLCYLRRNWMGATADGSFTQESISQRWPLDDSLSYGQRSHPNRQAPEGAQNPPYSGNPADYFDMYH